jgi:hypothetical protein
MSGRDGTTVSVLTPREPTLDGDVWTLLTALEEAADVMFGNNISLRAVMSDRV